MSKFIITFMLLLLPSLVYADWQYTKWGMTREEVVKASQGAATPDPESKAHSSEEHASLLTAPYTAGRFEFSARFMFDRQTRTLSIVNLDLKDPRQCNSLWGELNIKYGKPESKTSGIAESASWRDETANNSIIILKIGERSGSVQYRMLKGKENKGL